MAKKQVQRHARRSAHKTTKTTDYIVIVRSWMFVVAFALMLGMGAIIGNFVKTQFELSTPQVAGAATEAR